MSEKTKSRPTNNFHCFEGTGRQIWREVARGIGVKPDALANGPDGYRINYQPDSDGYVLNTGGISAPVEEKLQKGFIFWRFISTTFHNRRGPASALFGNWWVSDNDFYEILHIANATRKPLARVASAALYIPPEWGDCGYVVSARLSQGLKAWSGYGKVAIAGVSPGNQSTPPRVKDTAAGLPSVSNRIRQIFVPEPFYLSESEPSRPTSFFSYVYSRRTIHEFDSSFYS